MSKKGKTGKVEVAESSEEHYPIYVQSSNPSPELLAWMAEMSKETIVYLQSGSPPQPPPPPQNPPK
jgi:hypothetical protein